MNFMPFDSSFFDQTVVFDLTNLNTGARAGVTEGAPFQAVFQPSAPWGGAYVEPHRESRRDEKHGQPVGRKRWLIATPTSPSAQLPGYGLDCKAVWGAMTFRVAKDPYDGSQGQGLLWFTECEEFGSP